MPRIILLGLLLYSSLGLGNDKQKMISVPFGPVDCAQCYFNPTKDKIKRISQGEYELHTKSFEHTPICRCHFISNDSIKICLVETISPELIKYTTYIKQLPEDFESESFLIDNIRYRKIDTKGYVVCSGN